MTHGQKVAGGDRLGKTIIFAKNHEHAHVHQQTGSMSIIRTSKVISRGSSTSRLNMRKA